MATLRESRAQVTAQRKQLETQRKKVQEVETSAKKSREQIVQVKESLPEVRGQQALRQKFAGMKGRAQRRKIAGVEKELTGKEMEVKKFEKEVIKPARAEIASADVQLSQVEAQVTKAEREQAAYRKALKVADSSNAFAVFSLESGLEKKYYKMIKRDRAKAKADIESINKGVVPADIQKRLDVLQSRGLTEEKAWSALGYKFEEKIDKINVNMPRAEKINVKGVSISDFEVKPQDLRSRIPPQVTGTSAMTGAAISNFEATNRTRNINKYVPGVGVVLETPGVLQDTRSTVITRGFTPVEYEAINVAQERGNINFKVNANKFSSKFGEVVSGSPLLRDISNIKIPTVGLDKKGINPSALGLDDSRKVTVGVATRNIVGRIGKASKFVGKQYVEMGTALKGTKVEKYAPGLPETVSVVGGTAGRAAPYVIVAPTLTGFAALTGAETISAVEDVKDIEKREATGEIVTLEEKESAYKGVAVPSLLFVGGTAAVGYSKVKRLDLLKGKTVTKADLAKLETQIPDKSIAFEKSVDGKDILVVGSKKEAGRVGVDTVTEFEVIKVKGGVQIGKGTGTQTVTKKSLLFRDKDVVSTRKFTFSGGAEPTKATIVKGGKKTILEKASKDPRKAQAFQGELEILGKEKGAKLTRQPFVGIGKKVKKKPTIEVVSEEVAAEGKRTSELLKGVDEITVAVGKKVSKARAPKDIIVFDKSGKEFAKIPGKGKKNVIVKDFDSGIVVLDEKAGTEFLKNIPKDIKDLPKPAKTTKPGEVKLDSIGGEKGFVEMSGLKLTDVAKAKPTKTVTSETIKLVDDKKDLLLIADEKKMVGGITGQVVEETQLASTPVTIISETKAVTSRTATPVILDKKIEQNKVAIIEDVQTTSTITKPKMDFKVSKIKEQAKEKTIGITNAKDFKTIQAQETTTKPAFGFKSLFRKAVAKKTKLVTSSTTKAPPTPTTTTPTRIIPPPELTTPKEKGTTKVKATDIFKVLVAKGGKDIEIGEFETLREAKAGLKKRLLGTLRAGGVIKKGGKKVKVNLGFGFRQSKVDSFRVVQRKEQRFGTGGETREAQFFKKERGFF